MAVDWHYPLGLFDACGVELEYMIVDRDTLDIRPLADRLFAAAAEGSPVCDVEPDGPDGMVSWSNELALHVAELKTQRPAPSLAGLADHFQDHVRRINRLLEPMGARLLPTGMHPWMNPDLETTLWPHEYNAVYATYDRIFGCSGHGWGNLQSTHINLPFANDDEFGRLHAAIRLVLPLLPALAASSPIADGVHADDDDYRLEVYRTNSARVPLMTGQVIPEPVYTRAAYESEILGRLYDALAPHDPEGILRHEFANARGCIARFDRGAIEIRLLDIQECPAADLAIIDLVVAAVRAFVEEQWIDTAAQRRVDTAHLHRVLRATIRSAERTPIDDPVVLTAYGMPSRPTSAGALWRSLRDRLYPSTSARPALLDDVLEAGTLATRIRAAVGPTPPRDRLRAVYGRLADCLQRGSLFRG